MTSEQDQEHRTAKRTTRRVARASPTRRRPPSRRRAALSASPADIVGNDAKSLGIAMIFTAMLGLVVTTLLLSKRRRSVS